MARMTTLAKGYPLTNEYGSIPRSNVRPVRFLGSDFSTFPVKSSVTPISSLSSSSFSSYSLDPPISEPFESFSNTSVSNPPASSTIKSKPKRSTIEEEEERHLKSQSSSVRDYDQDGPPYRKVWTPSKISPNDIPCVIIHQHILDCPICRPMYTPSFWKQWCPWICIFFLTILSLWFWRQSLISMPSRHPPKWVMSSSPVRYTSSSPIPSIPNTTVPPSSSSSTT